MFPEISESSLGELLKKFPEQPVSFWSDARAAAWEAALGRWARSQESQQVMSLIRANRRVSLEGQSISAEQLHEIAQSMIDRDVRSVSYVTRELRGR
jgi:hypothetical protein